MDIRLIEQIQDYKIDKINKIVPLVYRLKANPKKQEIGLIAQELIKVEPLLVSTGANGIMNIDYEQLTVVLLSYIQQMDTRLAALENNIKQEKAKKNAKL